MRSLLALGLVLGLAPRIAPILDPALAMARASGALCLGDDPAGVPEDHVHDQCLACQCMTPGAALAEAPWTVPAPAAGTEALVRALARMYAAGWAAYASRAPPGAIG